MNTSAKITQLHLIGEHDAWRIDALMRGEAHQNNCRAPVARQLAEVMLAAGGDSSARQAAMDSHLARLPAGQAEAIREAIIRIDPNSPPDPDGEPLSRFQLLSLSALSSLPPLRWQVDEHIPEGSFSVVFGPSGGGKTFLILDMALSIATGLPWAGRVVKRGGVVYVSAEGSNGLKQRVAAWHEHNGRNIEATQDFHFVMDAVNLLNTDEVNTFVEAVKPVKPSLIVLDTLARCLVGGDENSAQDMGKAIAAIDHIRKATGATVLVVHHTTKASPDTERGSSSLRGAADAMLLVRNDDGLITLSCEKQKDGAPFTATCWKLDPNEDVGSCVPVMIEHNGGHDGQRPEKGLKQSHRMVLDAVRDASGGTEGGITISELARRTGLSKGQVGRALDKLRDGLYVLYEPDTFLYHTGRPNSSRPVPGKWDGQNQPIPETGMSGSPSPSRPVPHPLGVGRWDGQDDSPGRYEGDEED